MYRDARKVPCNERDLKETPRNMHRGGLGGWWATHPPLEPATRPLGQRSQLMKPTENAQQHQKARGTHMVIHLQGTGDNRGRRRGQKAS